MYGMKKRKEKIVQDKWKYTSDFKRTVLRSQIPRVVVATVYCQHARDALTGSRIERNHVSPGLHEVQIIENRKHDVYTF